MARGPHSSPQYTKFPKRKDARKKIEKLVLNNEHIIRKYNENN